MTSDDMLKRAAAGLRQMSEDMAEISRAIEHQRSGRFGDQTTAMERSCLGKRAYPTPERAGQAAAGRGVDGLRIYQCSFCNQYHLTSRTLAAFHGLDP